MDALKHIIEKSGKSARSVSLDIGKSPTYLYTVIGSKNDIGASKLAAVAKACGYKLILKSKDDEITVDPTE